MGHRFVGSFAAAFVLLLAAVPASATPPANFSEQIMASGLSTPTAVAFLPDRRMLVTEKGGALKLVQNGTATTLITLPVCTASEMGLLGVAPHPSFQSNGLVFLYRTKPPDGRLRQLDRPLQPGRDGADVRRHRRAGQSHRAAHRHPHRWR